MKEIIGENRFFLTLSIKQRLKANTQNRKKKKQIYLLFQRECHGTSLDKVSSIKYVRKTFRKTNISKPLIRIRTCAYQGVKNVIFSEKYAYVLNGWPLRKILKSDLPRRK